MPVTALDKKLFKNIPQLQNNTADARHALMWKVEEALDREGRFANFIEATPNANTTSESGYMGIVDRAIRKHLDSDEGRQYGIVRFFPSKDESRIVRDYKNRYEGHGADYFWFLQRAYERGGKNVFLLPEVGDELQNIKPQSPVLRKEKKAVDVMKKLFTGIAFAAQFALGLYMVITAPAQPASPSFDDVFAASAQKFIGWGLTIVFPIPAIKLLTAAIRRLREKDTLSPEQERCNRHYRRAVEYLRLRVLWFEYENKAKPLPSALRAIKKELKAMEKKYNYLKI
ncbi:MAG: hypothetical protein IJP03_02435 [Christensenellaceae bacterium]|nr:hypothetical protein [Christensenellaceae bacterium]